MSVYKFILAATLAGMLGACGSDPQTSSSVVPSSSSPASVSSSSIPASSSVSSVASSSSVSGPVLSGNYQYEVTPDSTGIANITSTEMAVQMGIGWNLGNALDAVDTNSDTREETLWGNPVITQGLFDGIAAAGFDTIRLPVAWSEFSDASSYTISAARMNRVEEVVNFILNANMKVMLNIHWDGGWMQPTYAQQDYVNDRLYEMWLQIGRTFRDYDDRLLFAGTNEVMVDGDYGTPTQEYYTVQNSFNQTFVDAVRSTGGRNAYRHLIVQGFNTNIDHTVNFAQMPSDHIEGRLLMEVHFYDPYEFTLCSDCGVTQWGANADASLKATWPSDEAHIDAQFNKMKTKYVDNGIGVVLGEYGVEAKDDVAGHEAFREAWVRYVTESALRHGMAPIYWDNGYSNSMGIFDRNTGNPSRANLVQILVNATN